MFSNKRIIVAPLHWGLGHATRCIPIINALKKNNTVAIASDGESLKLLRKEFPSLNSFELPSYNIRYTFDSMMANMIVQGPGSLSTILKENKRAKEIAKKWKADVLISDNRFGFRTDQTENIYITHQLNIPANNPMISNIASRIHHRIINKFDQCWVPDYKGSKNLAGKLSQVNLKTPTTYLGPLSRMVMETIPIQYDFTAVLSGPEPQRTKLESFIVEVFSNYPTHRFCLVRGTDQPNKHKTKATNTETFDLLTTKDLNRILNASSQTICRAGYTSIMDLIQLAKPSILIPTPGQYEQEYLAQTLEGRYNFLVCNQKNAKEYLTQAIEKTTPGKNS